MIIETFGREDNLIDKDVNDFKKREFSITKVLRNVLWLYYGFILSCTVVEIIALSQDANFFYVNLFICSIIIECMIMKGKNSCSKAELWLTRIPRNVLYMIFHF